MWSWLFLDYRILISLRRAYIRAYNKWHKEINQISKITYLGLFSTKRHLWLKKSYPKFKGTDKFDGLFVDHPVETL